VTGGDRLRRAYERLLWAYPRWYRRERGTELVTTLLDDAEPGRRRPTPAEAFDLVRGGLRTRLRLPGGLGVRAVAFLVTLYVAVIGAAVGVSLTGFPGAPSDEQAIAAAMVAVPQQPRNEPGMAIRCDIICPEWNGRDDVVAFVGSIERDDRVVVYHNPPRDRVPDTVAQARDRLAARGWQVTRLDVVDDGFTSFSASDGRLNLTLSGWTGDNKGLNPTASVRIAVSKVFPASMVVMALVLGFVGGLLVGRLVAAWALQRFQRHPLQRRVAAAVVAGPFLTIAPFLIVGAAWVLLVLSFLDPAKGVQAPLLVVPGGWVPGVNHSTTNVYVTLWNSPILLAKALTGLSAVGALGVAIWPGPARQEQLSVMPG
jgi:hypothetical protein